MKPSPKVALIILDGWGIGNGTRANAIAHARTPFFSQLMARYPNSRLRTSGEDVGLPEGQMGNSEVGHLNIGAGRVVYQDLVKINRACRDGSIDQHPVLLETFDYIKKSGKAIHLMGLVSDGCVHSSQEHLHHLLKVVKSHNLEHVFVHAFTDGRDTDPKSGYGFLAKLIEHMNTTTGTLASITGRYYAMDRDKRWERIKVAADALVHGKGRHTFDPLMAVQESYDEGITDEFIQPIIISHDDNSAVGPIREGDAVICFNFRTDRCREITIALTQKDMPEHGLHTLPLHYITMTNYDNSFKNIKVIYEKEDLRMTLGETLEAAGKKQIRIAETEKYPHVTFFFSGGREKPFEGERRILIPSPKVATYDLKPEMSAVEVTDAIVSELEKSSGDFICLNYANPDMVGHTGDYKAVVKAVETVDQCLERVVQAGLKTGYSFVIIADHGNADFMINTDGSPNTAHTTNPVPCILIDKSFNSIQDGRLADIAPTILQLLELKAPKEMTGHSLL
ncbi:MAG TPA: 2,3-bisphosphoglycerate-independent phosphoglycerate mutase [Bacteroidia bacterium]|nr:2,3-bisphosphoglycerate-independent phosphoglycerate mutase [Bacteroidia bacterium]